MEIIFLGSIFFIFFAYFGYPFSLCLLGLFIDKRVDKASHFPPLTVIITAYNEEKKIKKKLDNTVALEYAREKLQILVASDGSTDRTNEIVSGYHKRGVELIEILERRGKENAQKEAVSRANGDVIVFTDVATMLDPEGLKQIVSNFADQSVGCVSSEDKLIGKDGKPCGEGFYVQYEMWLRRLESKVNSLVGLSGSFFAARKEVCRDFSGEMQSDFRIVLNSMKLGFRGVADPYAVGHYQDVTDQKHEFDRKTRTVLRGLTVFFSHLEFLDVLRYGFFSYQYFSHKFLKWLVPAFLFIVFISTTILAQKSLLFSLLLAAQLGFYALALWGWKKRGLSSNMIMKVPVYFLVANTSICVAWWRYIRGERVVIWSPSER